MPVMVDTPNIPPDAGRQRAEWLACSRSPAYFLDRHGRIYDSVSRAWIPFELWPAQVAALDALRTSPRVVILKARQLGMSWLTVGYALWLMLFRPAATVLLFSRRDEEAAQLLGFRLRGMLERLPPHLSARGIARDSAHELRLSNGSAALAFPTTGGRSYAASLAIVDEADFTGNLDALLNAVKPTVDAGGQLVLLSTVDKLRPESAFKRIYRAAEKGENGWTPVFLSWRAHPGRTDAWYAGQVADIQARTGGLDDLRQEYPADAFEALAPRSTDKFFPAHWLAGCWADDPAAIPGAEAPPLPGLTIHAAPEEGHAYAIGADPAEGNPQSDESAACLLDAITGDQVAVWAGRFEPATFANGLAALAAWVAGLGGTCGVLVERNNHGHAVLLALRETSAANALRGLTDRLLRMKMLI